MPGAGRPISFVGSTFRSAFGRCRRRRSLGVSSSASTSPAVLYRMCRFFCSTTAALDAGNRAVVVDLVAEKKRRGTAVVAIVHDDDVRTAIADTVIDVHRFSAAA